MGCAIHIGPPRPQLIEQFVLNPDYLPAGMASWRMYRIEYGFECSCPEGLIWLPPQMAPETIERILAEGESTSEGITCG